MAKEKVIKTNAIRMLDKAKVPYVHRSWEQATGQHTGVELAAALGQNPEQVFKTLVTVASCRSTLHSSPFFRRRLVSHGANTPMPKVPTKDSRKDASCIRYGFPIVISTPATHSELQVSPRRKNSGALCISRYMKPARRMEIGVPTMRA